MGTRITRHSEHKVSMWTGGETTELAIFPSESHYAQRDFAWRVSSATVTVPASEFTRLPGYSRQLLVLDGELRLQPAGGPEVMLAPGGQYHFDGATPITSHGLATDFNLMLAEGWAGRVTRMMLAPASSGRWQPDRDAQHAMVYCYRGQARLSSAYTPSTRMDAGDLLWAAADAADPGLPVVKMINDGADRLVLVLVTVFARH